MTRSRLQGRALVLGWGIAVAGGFAAPDAQARQDWQEHQDRAGGDAAKAHAVAGATPHGKPDAATVPSAAPAATATTSPASGKTDTAVSPAPGPTTAPASAPDPTDGDRTALINQDVAQHPPQTQIASRDPSHLQTTKMKLGGLLDRSVHSLENNEVGRVIDVMTGDDGKPAALELDVGGFMGVGNRRIAVAWSLFDLSRAGQNDPLRVALSAAQVRSAPAMDEVSGEMPVVTGAAPIGPEQADHPASPQTAPAAAPPAAADAGAAAGPAPAAALRAAPTPAAQGTDHGNAGTGKEGDKQGRASVAPALPVAPHSDPATAASKAVAPSTTPARTGSPHHDEHDKASVSGSGDQRF